MPKRKPRDPEQSRQYRLANLDKIKAYRLANRDSIRAWTREYRKRNKAKIAAQEKAAKIPRRDAINARQREVYAQQRDKRTARQREIRASRADEFRKVDWARRGLPEPTRPRPAVCECCGAPPNTKVLVLDHCHATMLFRGWLCDRCNRGLGFFGDSATGLRQAITYLETHGSEHLLT